MSSGGSEASPKLDVRLVGIERPAGAGSGSTVVEELSSRDRTSAFSVKIGELLRSVLEETRNAADDNAWEVEVSGLFAVGIGSTKTEFNATFRLSSNEAGG